MAKIIKDIWILTQTGTVVFKRVFNSNVKAQLFGGLMSALNSFANELESGGLTNFGSSSMKFTLLKNHDFLFVCTAEKKVKEKRLHEVIIKVAEKFFNLYPAEWCKNEWDGDISIFDNFVNEIKFALQQPAKKV